MPNIPTNSQVIDAFSGAKTIQPMELQKNLQKAGWHVTAATAGIETAINAGVLEQTANGGLRVVSLTP